jgi:predicted nucleic acid-binding protein
MTQPIIKRNLDVARTNCLDASALVRKYVDEIGSDILRDYLNFESLCYTTLFCYFEALGVLKRKWTKKEISKGEYYKAARSLTAWFSCNYHDVPDIDFTDPAIFRDVESLSEKYSIDLSDAFQIISVKKGYFSSLTDKSSTILVSADKALVKAARKEGIKVYNFLTDQKPQ